MKLISEDARQKIKDALDEGEMLAQVTLDTIDPFNRRAIDMTLDSLRKIRAARELL